MQNENIAKIIMPLSKCIPGMTLLQPIVDIDTGSTIIGKDQLLTEEVLKRIEKFKHTEVWVSITPESNVWQVEEKVIESYKKYVNVLKHIIGNDTGGVFIPLHEVEELAQCIVEDFTYNFNLLACVHLVNKMEKDVYSHSMNVTFLSLLIARWVNFDPSRFKEVAMAALLHDIGKIDIAGTLLQKVKDLTIKEKIELRRHPINGYEKLIAYNELNNEVLKAILTHHERCDGSGFPLNLTEERINDISKIIGLADEYDNLRSSKNIFETIKILRCDMIRKFDINMLIEFCNNVINYYIGEHVILNTGEVAEIVFIQPRALHKPIVKVNEKYIDLYENVQIEIVQVL